MNDIETWTLETTDPTIKKMAKSKAKLATIYKLLRQQERFQGVGDYQLVSWIARSVGEIRNITPIEITKALNITIDGDFKRIHSNNDLVGHIYAHVEVKNGKTIPKTKSDE